MTQDVKITAQKLRNELKTTFKNCRFSVKINRYSMGASVDIYWEDGISEMDVNAVINKVRDECKAQGEEIQKSTSIFMHRSYSKENKEAVKTALIEELIENPIQGLEEWDFYRMVNNRASSTTFF
jgi:secreted trypsin-like serine protease